MSNWCDASMIQLKEEKCRILHVSRQTQPIIHDYSLNGSTLKTFDHHKHLHLVSLWLRPYLVINIYSQSVQRRLKTYHEVNKTFVWVQISSSGRDSLQSTRQTITGVLLCCVEPLFNKLSISILLSQYNGEPRGWYVARSSHNFKLGTKHAQTNYFLRDTSMIGTRFLPIFLRLNLKDNLNQVYCHSYYLVNSNLFYKFVECIHI